METINKLVRSLSQNDKDGYTVSVLIALILVSVLAASYYILLKPPEERYMTIYLLDSQKKALNYPELLVVNQNNTLSVFVNVENHEGESQLSEVLLKVANYTVPLFPVNVAANANYTRTLENGETWEIPASVTITMPGNYSVIFELWTAAGGAGELQYSGNACVLNVEVVSQV